MRHRVRDASWQFKLNHLMHLVNNAQSGDEIVVRSQALADLGETYRLQHCPDKEIVWTIEPLKVNGL